MYTTVECDRHSYKPKVGGHGCNKGLLFIMHKAPSEKETSHFKKTNEEQQFPNVAKLHIKPQF
jgi:hypothetical protein